LEVSEAEMVGVLEGKKALKFLPTVGFTAVR
jgi:hypothetical protein